jgi:succinate dehydrogenase (ubiquinone) cytochrome b560 subunit
MGTISAAGGDVIGTIHAIQSSVPVLVYPLKFCVGFPLAYHYLGGIRHLYWDFTAKGLESTAAVTNSSYAVLGLSAGIGVALAALEIQ